jgi:putative DNA primase/helicase
VTTPAGAALFGRNGHGALEPPSLTDAGNARRLVSDHGELVRYVPPWRTWLCFDGARWAKDETGEIVRRAKATARAILLEAADTEDPDARKALVKHAVQSEAEPRLRAMIALACSEPGIPVLPDQLDVDPFLLNTPPGTGVLRGASGGTVDLRTGTMRPHRREDLLAQITAVPYLAGARHPVFEAYLRRVLPDEGVRGFMQRVAGYCLTGSTAEETLFFAHGPSASGKSTLLRALRRWLGDYGATADFTSFTERRGDGPKEDIARLADVRLVVSVEVKDGTRLAEGLVKWLTGGDEITARRLYEKTVEFVPRFKLLLAANSRPRARDDDDAIWRRILEIPFTQSIPEAERDPEVKRILCEDPEAGAAILAWAVEGAVAWCQGRLGVPDAVRRATASYRGSMDPLGPFLAECCVLEEVGACPAGELRQAYESWAKEQGLRYPLAGRQFADRLRAKGCKAHRGTGGAREWRGIRLRGLLDPVPSDTSDGSDAISQTSLYARAHEESYGSDVTGVTTVTSEDEAPSWVTE